MTAATPMANASGEKRVLVANRVAFLGGAERVLLTIAGSIRPLGYSPLLTCPDGGVLADAARAHGIPVEGWKFNRMRITYNPLILAGYPLAWARARQHLLRLAAASGADLIHVHHPVVALYSIHAARRLGIPLILHMHDGPEMRLPHRLALQHAVRHSDRVICVSKRSRDLVESVGGKLNKVSLIYNGLDPAIMYAAYAPTPEVTGPGPHVGIFGVIEPSKGHETFLRAATLLAKQYPTAHFWIVGPDTYDDKASYRERIARIAAEPPLAGRVTFAGFRSDISRWIQAMNIVAMPSIVKESFGLAAAEAMALGRPVVASRAGGLIELIREGETGLLTPPGDAAALAAAFDALLRGNAEEMGKRAALDMRNRFCPDAFVRRVAEVYSDALS